MKIYQVCREYYDCPDSAIIKTFLSKERAEKFKNKYLKSPKWKHHDDTECVVINEHKVEDIQLKQEPVLDKIRADVINIADGRRSIPVRSVIKIIDKYTTERSNRWQSVN